MKILSAAAIALLLLAGCSSTSTPVPSGMISWSVDVDTRTTRTNFRNEVYRHWDRISLIQPMTAKSCGQVISLLRPTDESSEEALQKSLRYRRCTGSSDGLIPGERNGARFMYFIPEDDSLTDRLEGYDELNKIINELMDSRELYEPGAVDQLLTQCKGRCPSALILGSHFAKANYYDSVNRPLTAAIWRYFALARASTSSAFIEAHEDAFVGHVRLAFFYAADADDYNMAEGVSAWVAEKSPLWIAFKEHLDGWAAINEKNAADPIGYNFPLVTDTPLSDYHAVGFRTLAVKEFKIDILAGAIDYAFLSCDSNQVELQVELKRAWQVPSDWGGCDVYIFGEEGTEVRLWELPAGSVDQNGNLSA